MSTPPQPPKDWVRPDLVDGELPVTVTVNPGYSIYYDRVYASGEKAVLPASVAMQWIEWGSVSRW